MSLPNDATLCYWLEGGTELAGLSFSDLVWLVSLDGPFSSLWGGGSTSSNYFLNSTVGSSCDHIGASWIFELGPGATATRRVQWVAPEPLPTASVSVEESALESTLPVTASLEVGGDGGGGDGGGGDEGKNKGGLSAGAVAGIVVGVLALLVVLALVLVCLFVVGKRQKDAEKVEDDAPAGDYSSIPPVPASGDQPVQGDYGVSEKGSGVSEQADEFGAPEDGGGE
uniref:Uncharacterized protein n=1 Tax=Coptotermes formosanus TaxID=36987 RepID=R4UX10_COPFO|nr:hypothetical protein [Coptotermes formosanus]